MNALDTCYRVELRHIMMPFSVDRSRLEKNEKGNRSSPGQNEAFYHISDVFERLIDSEDSYTK